MTAPFCCFRLFDDVIMVSKLKFISVRVLCAGYRSPRGLGLPGIFQNLYIGKAVGFHQLPSLHLLIVSNFKTELSALF